MKHVIIILSSLAFSIITTNACFSELVILEQNSYNKEHAKYRPLLKVNKKDPDFIDVRIPYHKGGHSYWLVIADKKLENKLLNFRNAVWGIQLPKQIQSISKLGEAVDPLKDRLLGYIDITIRKNILSRCYIYSDYDHQILDGGFYYTYDLSKHNVEQVAVANPRRRLYPQFLDN